MRLGVLAREALASAVAARVATALVLLVTAAMCVVVLLTSGQAQANRQEVQRRLASDSSRVLTVSPVGESFFINRATIETVRRLSSSEVTLGLGTPTDAYNAALGPGAPLVPMWDVAGDLPGAVTLTDGRLPAPGEAIISEKAQSQFAMAGPVGAAETATGRQAPIVGVFRPVDAFPNLGEGVLVAVADDAQRSYGSLRVLADSTATTAATQQAVLAILAPPDPSRIQVDSPISAARTALDLDQQLATYTRTLLATVLGIGAFFVGAVVLADVLIRSRDLGRRRTLGITRTDLVLLVTARTALAAATGALVACVTAGLAMAGTVPAQTVAATGILAVVATILAAVPPAVFAARRDPVRVMRTA